MRFVWKWFWWYFLLWIDFNERHFKYSKTIQKFMLINNPYGILIHSKFYLSMFGFENEYYNYSNEKPQNLYKHLTCTIHFEINLCTFQSTWNSLMYWKLSNIFIVSQATFALNEIKNPINCKSWKC